MEDSLNTTVILTKMEIEDYELAEEWAKRFCKSFISCEIFDISDFSLYYDDVAEYTFSESKDAMFFILKWKINERR
jgi:hypothetical protein